MKVYYVDAMSKPGIFRLSPLIYTFKTGNELYVFPGRCNEKRLAKAISKSGATPVDERVSSDFKKQIYRKIILQSMKEYDTKELTFSFDNPTNYIDFLTDFFVKEISFSLADSDKAHEVAEFFLGNFGLPVNIVSRIKNGLYVFEGDKKHHTDKSVFELNLEKSVNSEFIFKELDFPIKINSLPLLQSALALTGKSFFDIIVKPCIIRHNDE